MEQARKEPHFRIICQKALTGEIQVSLTDWSPEMLAAFKIVATESGDPFASVKAAYEDTIRDEIRAAVEALFARHPALTNESKIIQGIRLDSIAQDIRAHAEQQERRNTLREAGWGDMSGPHIN